MFFWSLAHPPPPPKDMLATVKSPADWMVSPPCLLPHVSRDARRPPHRVTVARHPFGLTLWRGGLGLVGASERATHSCLERQNLPAMEPKDMPCFFCLVSSANLCSSSCPHTQTVSTFTSVQWTIAPKRSQNSWRKGIKLSTVKTFFLQKMTCLLRMRTLLLC